MTKNHKDLILDLHIQLMELPIRDKEALDALERKTEMVIRNIFGQTSTYLNDLRRIGFYPQIHPTDESTRNERWRSGEIKFKNLLDTMLQELTIFGDEVSENQTVEKREHKKVAKGAAKVFIVHGRDNATKTEVARYVEKFGLQAIILHEQSNNGRTIIEKFEGEASDVDFAIVLLTADDQGSLAESDDSLKPRARQNVIFELGYFIGVLSRAKVVALREEGVELPSDYAGIVYIDLDNQDSWKLKLAAEIKSAGIEIDLNKAIG